MQTTRRIPLSIARWRLARIWFPACGVFFLILVAQTLSGAYRTNINDYNSQAWGWALPNFLPTLALMISVFAGDALRNDDEELNVRENFFQLAKWLSVFYIFILYFVLLSPAINQFFDGRAVTPESRLDAMDSAGVFLGPLQSLTVGSLGVLFYLRESAHNRKSRTGNV